MKLTIQSIFFGVIFLICSSFILPIQTTTLNKKTLNPFFMEASAMCGGENIRKEVTFIRNETMEKLGKCYGYASCSACTTCEYCKHCNNGGVCGACNYVAPKKSYPKIYGNSSSSSKSKTQIAIDYHNKYSYSDKEALEKLLSRLGYSVGLIDGIFTETTISAIKKFQKDEGLTVDGKIGSTTLKHILDYFE
jgi:hypothetical protein